MKIISYLFMLFCCQFLYSQSLFISPLNQHPMYMLGNYLGHDKEVEKIFVDNKLDYIKPTLTGEKTNLNLKQFLTILKQNRLSIETKNSNWKARIVGNHFILNNGQQLPILFNYAENGRVAVFQNNSEDLLGAISINVDKSTCQYLDSDESSVFFITFNYHNQLYFGCGIITNEE